MCGIAGIVNPEGSAVDPDMLRNMIETIRYRGPDDCRMTICGNAGLAHARLSVIDIATGQQPMSNPEHSLWITYNGEIFNYLELREELTRLGHRFATASDTEVVLRMYQEKGEECVRDFNGEWAFAIWDARERKLFASRDRMGVRPLFYSMQRGTFLFGSEMKAVLAHPRVPRRLDVKGLDEVFTFWCNVAPRTVFDGIAELSPGHSLSLRDGRIDIRRYWDLDYPLPGCRSEQDEGELAERLLALLSDATRLRLRADVPVGVYLSGGLDSSVIAALARRCNSAPLHTFSVAFDDPQFDESVYQQQVARFLGCEHHEVRCTAQDISAVFPQMVWHAERPLLRTAPAPLFLLSRLVRSQGHKVVLTGEGADEILGGYDTCKETKVRRYCAARPDSRRRALLFRRLYPYLPAMQAQSPPLLEAAFRTRPDLLSSPFFSHLPRWDAACSLKAFYSDEMREALAGRDPYRELSSSLPARYDQWEPFCQAQYLESSGLLPGYILSSQGDRASMAHAVETRFPYLDTRVVELAGALPSRLKMRVLNEKYLLKRSAQGLVPLSVLGRPKQPYRPPDASSFFNDREPEYLAALLAPEQIRRDGLFHPAAVSRLVETLRRGESTNFRDNMALVGILSTQLLKHQFERRAEVWGT
jgi:asparagine synthase (glutamine-hydrolysing)